MVRVVPHLQQERQARHRTEQEMNQLRQRVQSGGGADRKIKAYDQIMSGLVGVRPCVYVYVAARAQTPWVLAWSRCGRNA